MAMGLLRGVGESLTMEEGEERLRDVWEEFSAAKNGEQKD